VDRSSLDLSDRALLEPLAGVLAAVQRAAGETPFLLIGAAARDLLLVYAGGIAAQRATEDTDVALAVRSWEEFMRLRAALVATEGCMAGGPLHQLWLGDQRLDIVPFGGVERSDRSIAWPTEGAGVMNVSGLSEALATAIAVRLPGGVVANVASLPALAALKLWAWADRKYSTPGKDASDIWMLLRHYADAGNQDRLYGPEGEIGLAAFEFDLDKAGAWLLGRDARAVLAASLEPGKALKSLETILLPEIDPDGALRLVAQMPGWDRERQLALLTAFCAGLFDSAFSEA
jgi:predicted nucleotidyltransferase